MTSLVHFIGGGGSHLYDPTKKLVGNSSQSVANSSRRIFGNRRISKCEQIALRIAKREDGSFDDEIAIFFSRHKDLVMPGLYGIGYDKKSSILIRKGWMMLDEDERSIFSKEEIAQYALEIESEIASE